MGNNNRMRLIDANELLEHVWRDKLNSRELIAKMIDDAPTIYDREKCGEASIIMGNRSYSEGCISDFVSILLANGYEVNIKRNCNKFNIEYYRQHEPMLEF